MPDNVARDGASVAVYSSRISRANHDVKIHLPGNRHKYRNKSKHVNSTKEDKHFNTKKHLYMTMHVRERNNDRLFEVENADCPPSLSKHGILRSGQKS